MNIKTYKYEFEKILGSYSVVDSINSNLNNLIKIIPEIGSMIGFDHKHPQHHLDVWQHTLCALSLSPNNIEIRMVLLLHDIGKPYCYQEDENIRHFRGHAKKSEEMARTILTRLNYPKKYIDEVCLLIEYHDTRVEKINFKNANLYRKLYYIQYCDAMAHNPKYLEKRKEYLLYVKKRLMDNFTPSNEFDINKLITPNSVIENSQNRNKLKVK